MSTAGTQHTESLVPHKLVWTSVIIGLLALQIFMCSIAVFLATSDDSMSIESNYGAKSLQWDETMAAKRASESLHWASAIEVSPVADLYGKRDIRLSLHDSSGSPVHAATVTLTLFHHAHASRAQDISLDEVPNSPGQYAASAVMRNGGLWEFRITAKKDDDTFQLTEQRDVP